MVIAVNATLWGNPLFKSQNFYAAELIKQAALAHPEHQFVCIVPPLFNYPTQFPGNVQFHLTKYTITAKAGLFQQIMLPAIIQKINPQLIIQPNGSCNLFTKCPQLLCVNNAVLPHFVQQLNWLQQWWHQFITPLMLKKATRIITGALETMSALPLKYPFTQNHLQYIPGAAFTQLTPIEWEQKEAIKQQYTMGCEYFLVPVQQTAFNNIIQVLKAFSQFKKWHKSNMKLLITSTLPGNTTGLLQKLQSYKYKNEVILMEGGAANSTNITASAYAMIALNNTEGLNLHVIETMQLGVPIIIAQNEATSVAENATIYADITNPAKIAEYMQLLYKDEKYRQTYVNRGIDKAKSFHWRESAKAFWEEITKTVNLSY